MSVFCTPDGRPFYAGTYFPPEDRHGMPSFRRVVEALGTAWETERDKVLAQADALVDAVRREVSLAELMTESEAVTPHAPAPGIDPDGAHRPAGHRALAGFRPPMGRIRARPEVPPPGPGRAVPAPLPPHRFGAVAPDGADHPRRHGGRRHLRPPGRRLLPLLDRRAVAGPPLREDADRPGSAGPRLPPRLAGDRPGRLPGRGHRDARLRAGRPVHPRGRPLLLLRRRRRRGRGQPRHLHPGRAPTTPSRRIWSNRRPSGTGSPPAGNWEGRSIPFRPVGAPLRRPPEIEEARLLLVARARGPGPTGPRREGPDRVERHGRRHAGRGGRRDRLGPLRPPGRGDRASSSCPPCTTTAG